jgi:hypothetical protein
MHIHSIAYVVLIIIGPLEVLGAENGFLAYLQSIPAAYFTWYLFKASKVMYRESWWKTIAKVVAIYFIYMAALGVTFDYLLRLTFL